MRHFKWNDTIYLMGFKIYRKQANSWKYLLS